MENILYMKWIFYLLLSMTLYLYIIKLGQKQEICAVKMLLIAVKIMFK